jgi:hypothetical protein
LQKVNDNPLKTAEKSLKMKGKTAREPQISPQQGRGSTGEKEMALFPLSIGEKMW